MDVTRTVDDLPVDTKTGKSMQGSGGGDFICKTLKQVVEQGRPSFSTRVMYRLFDLLGPAVLPKRTRVEHWPMDD